MWFFTVKSEFVEKKRFFESKNRFFKVTKGNFVQKKCDHLSLSNRLGYLICEKFFSFLLAYSKNLFLFLSQFLLFFRPPTLFSLVNPSLRFLIPSFFSLLSFPLVYSFYLKYPSNNFLFKISFLISFT